MTDQPDPTEIPALRTKKARKLRPGDVLADGWVIHEVVLTTDEVRIRTSSAAYPVPLSGWLTMDEDFRVALAPKVGD